MTGLAGRVVGVRVAVRAAFAPRSTTGGVGMEAADRSEYCAVCCRPRATEIVHLTHGVAVRLCSLHRETGFLRRRGGRTFVDRLARIWAASGVLTVRRRQALVGHLRRARPRPAARPQPGSYSWPRLREEAERRFAAGEAPGTVIPELRSRLAGAVALAPSVRTMRRWFGEARWLAGSEPARVDRRRDRRPSGQEHLSVHGPDGRSWIAKTAGIPRHPFWPDISWEP